MRFCTRIMLVVGIEGVGTRERTTCFSRINLQTLLPQYEQHEVDQVGRQPMEEQHVDAVMEAIRCNATVRIPETRFHGILIANFLAHLNHLAPLHLAMIGTRDVVHRDLVGSLILLLHDELIRYDAQSIDGVVHGYDLGLVTRID